MWIWYTIWSHGMNATISEMTDSVISLDIKRTVEDDVWRIVGDRLLDPQGIKNQIRTNDTI